MISKEFKLDHLDLVNFKINYPNLNELKGEVYPFDEDKALTYIKDDKIIFCCGLKLVRRGVAHCWVIPSVYVDNYAKSFYKEINNLLESYVKKMNIHRVQTTITDEFVKWIEMLGFEKESTLKQMTFDKKDEYFYTKFY
jgi:hypothetical protein